MKRNWLMKGWLAGSEGSMMVDMCYVAKSSSRTAALAVCAAVALFAFSRPAFADNPGSEEMVTDSDDDSDDPVDDTTVDGGYADTDPSAVTAFRSDLAPYGSWADDERYGTVWVPDSNVVGADFTPYQSAGHWDMAGDGDWMWASDYDWGYIPFHYGRWVWTGASWAWIPGRAYANAWVSWRVGYDGYIGWAPLPPAYYWWNGGVVVLGRSPYASYGFCRTDDVYSHNLHQHMIRDKAEVQRAAGSTHSYGGGGTGRSYTPASPTLADAHISPRLAPVFKKTDSRAAKLQKPPAGARSMPGRSAGMSERGGAPTSAAAFHQSSNHAADNAGAPQRANAVRPSAGGREVESRSSVNRSSERGSEERFSDRASEPRTAGARRLDQSRTLSSESTGREHVLSSEPRNNSRTDVRSMDEVHVIRRPSTSIGAEPRGAERSPAFDRRSPSFESPRGSSPAYQAPRSEAPRSSGFEYHPNGGYSGGSSPHYSPSFSHSAPSGPAPSRHSSAPSPSFRGGGGGGGMRMGGGGHHR